MHLIDTGDAAAGTNGAPINEFDEGDPGVPRLPTQVDKHILNAVMREIANTITNAGISLVKGTNTQLAAAVVNILTNQTIAGVKSFTGTINAVIVAIARNAAFPAMTIANSDTGAGYAANMSSAGTAPTAQFTNTGTGPALKLSAVDGQWPLQFVPQPTLPTTNPAGGALSAADDGAVVYLAGAYNKLYCYENSLGWVALW